jgi:hypothetical protein
MANPQKEIQQKEAQKQPEAVKQETQVQLSVADLQNLAKIIDLATRRGAFGAADLLMVGTVYDRLAKFLSATDQSNKESNNG